MGRRISFRVFVVKPVRAVMKGESGVGVSGRGITEILSQR